MAKADRRPKGVPRWKREIHRDGLERASSPRPAGSEASFKIGIIMFFHLSELETMTRRLSILWEQKSVRKTSAGFSSLFVFFYFFFFFSFFILAYLSTNNEATDRVGRIPSREGRRRGDRVKKLKDNRIKVAFVRVYKDRLHARTCASREDEKKTDLARLNKRGFFRDER